MALEIFMRVDEQGNDNGAYIFWGKAADLRGLAAPLQLAYEANKRMKTVEALATKILDASKLPTPIIRLEKPEARMLMDAVASAAEGKAASHRFSKLEQRIEGCLFVY